MIRYTRGRITITDRAGVEPTSCECYEVIRDQFERLFYRSGYNTREALEIFGRLIWRGILPGGWRRISWFLSTFPLLRPSWAPIVVAEWITALSMRDLQSAVWLCMFMSGGRTDVHLLGR